jgi:hypothetical protein
MHTGPSSPRLACFCGVRVCPGKKAKPSAERGGLQSRLEAAAARRGEKHDPTPHLCDRSSVSTSYFESVRMRLPCGGGGFARFGACVGGGRHVVATGGHACGWRTKPGRGSQAFMATLQLASTAAEHHWPASSVEAGQARALIGDWQSVRRGARCGAPTCAYISRMRWYAVSPAPKVKSTTRSTPSCRTSSRRRVRRCLRSLRVKFEGASGLSRMTWRGGKGGKRAYC